MYGCRVLKPGIVHLLHVDARTAAEEGFGGRRRSVLSSALATWPGDTLRRRRQTPSSAGRRYDRPHPNAKCRQSVHRRSIILCLCLCRKRFFWNVESGSCVCDGHASPTVGLMLRRAVSGRVDPSSITETYDNKTWFYSAPYVPWRSLRNIIRYFCTLFLFSSA